MLNTITVKEMQIATTVRFHFILTRITVIKRHTISSVGMDVQKWEPSYITGGDLQ